MAMELQKAYCEKKNYPMFAPLDGRCFGCNRMCPDDGEKLITGCPHCNRTWCD